MTYRHELVKYKAKRDGIADAKTVQQSRKKKQRGDWTVMYSWGIDRSLGELRAYVRFRAPTEEKALDYITRIARKDNCHIAQSYDDALAYAKARYDEHRYVFCRVMWIERDKS